MSGEAMSYIHTARVLCSMFTAATFNNSRLKCERSITYRRARVNIKENRQNSDDIISDVRGPNRQTIKNRYRRSIRYRNWQLFPTLKKQQMNGSAQQKQWLHSTKKRSTVSADTEIYDITRTDS